MLIKRLQKVHLNLIQITFLTLILSACAAYAPVQEMSNARQSLQAAKDANAERYASSLFNEANKRLHSATLELDAGEYERARILALEAKHLALKARQLSTSKKVN